MIDPVDYQLLLKYPDRDEPENSDFTSFTGKITEGDVLSLPEKGEWRVEEVRRMRTTSRIHSWSASRRSPNGRRAPLGLPDDLLGRAHKASGSGSNGGSPLAGAAATTARRRTATSKASRS